MESNGKALSLQFLALSRQLMSEGVDLERLFSATKESLATITSNKNDGATSNKPEPVTEMNPPSSQPKNNSQNLRFQTPRNPIKRPKIDTAPVTEVNNRFEAIANDEEEMVFEESANENIEDETNMDLEDDANQTDNNSRQTAQKKNKIAPIIIRNKKNWNEISKLIRTNNIVYTKAKLISQGVQVEPYSEDDYRNLFKILKTKKEEFYTYQLKSEKKLKVVIRGIMTEITEEDISSDLNEQGYPAIKVLRMKGRLGFPAPLVLVEIDREYKSIYNKLHRVCGLSVSVESLRVKTEVIQCHKCQLFGHCQKNCHAAFKCMKCGEEHSTHLCKKPKTTAPKCANCGGEHLSISLRCTKNPNNPTNRPTTEKRTSPAPQPNDNIWKRRMEEHKKQEDKAKTTETNTETNKYKETNKNKETKEEELATILGKMLLNFTNLNPSIEQTTEFITEQRKVINLFRKK